MQHSSCQLSVLGKLRSRTAGWFGVKSVCSFLFFFLWRYLGVSSFYPRLPFLFRSWWLTLPPLLLGSSLLWNGIAFSFVKDFLVAASYYSRSEITWNGWKFSKTTGELWCGCSVVGVDGGAYINKENCSFFLFSELNLFGGHFLTTHKLIPASCRFTLKHEVACWCKGKQSLFWLPWKQVRCTIGYQPCWSCQNHYPPMCYRLLWRWMAPVFRSCSLLCESMLDCTSIYKALFPCVAHSSPFM